MTLADALVANFQDCHGELSKIIFLTGSRRLKCLKPKNVSGRMTAELSTISMIIDSHSKNRVTADIIPKLAGLCQTTLSGQLI